jgi:Glycosyl transferase 4-like domain/Glycosyl transferases group 1
MEHDRKRPVYFLRSADVSIDSRLRRYQLALEQQGHRVRSIFWHRGGPGKSDATPSTIRYVTKTGFGQQKATLLAFAFFNLFVFRSLWRNRKNVAVVHAIDLDTVLPAALFARITGIPLVFDLYDSFIDSRAITGWLRIILGSLERWAIRQSQLVIIADQLRIAQHPPIPADKLLVIENVPAIQALLNLKPARVTNAALRLGYMGTLEAYGRGIEDVCDAVESLPFVELDIVGAGALETSIKERAKKCSRIKFHGPKYHADGLAIMQNADILVGLYYTFIPNHAFAAPNKYYEHLLLGIPMLTSLHTPPGAKVTANGTGWAVADNKSAIMKALTEAHQRPELVAQYGATAKQLWQKDYAQYFEHAIAGSYCERIDGLIAVKAKATPYA